MTEFFAWTAAVVAVGAVVVHLVAGGRALIRPLLASELPPSVVSTAWFAWHVGTLSFATIAAGLVAGAMSSDFRGLATISTVAAVAVVLIGLTVCLRMRLSPLRFAPVLLFSVVAAFAVVSELV